MSIYNAKWAHIYELTLLHKEHIGLALIRIRIGCHTEIQNAFCARFCFTHRKIIFMGMLKRTWINTSFFWLSDFTLFYFMRAGPLRFTNGWTIWVWLDHPGAEHRKFRNGWTTSECWTLQKMLSMYKTLFKIGDLFA